MSLVAPRILRAGAAPQRRSRAWQRVREGAIYGGLVGCAVLSIAITFAIVGVLLVETIRFFLLPDVNLREFFGTWVWNPRMGQDKHFGVWPLVSGTLVITVVAMAVAGPLGLVTAIYLSEYAPRRVRAVVKPLLEILAGIPTVVYGFLALTVFTPALKFLHDGFNVYNAFSAGAAVGILCLPIICSLTEDALQAVPRNLREAAYGLGGTRFDVSVKVVVPAALSGIISAFLLAFARAMGETMIVALAAGGTPQITGDVRQPMLTMTGYMVQVAEGDVSHGSPEYYGMYAVAFVLFLLTMGLTLAGQFVRARFREAYQ